MIALSLALALQISSFQNGLANDAVILERAYRSMHPGLYRYNTSEQMSENFSLLKSEWRQCKDIRQAYVALSKFSAKVKCGHTYPNFFNQEKPIVQSVFAGNNRVPFLFRWLNGKMVVLKDFTKNRTIPRGSVIQKINGIPCSKILNTLMKVARADGANDFKRQSYLSVTGDDRWEAFDIYLPLMFEIPEGGFSIQLCKPGKASQLIKTEALSMEQRASLVNKSSITGEGKDPWSFRFEKKAAYLTMRSWQFYDGKWNWEKFLSEVFAKLKSNPVPNLIIDLRGNEGGSSVGEVLAAYLTAKPLRANDYLRYTRYATVDVELKPFLDTWDRSFDDWSKWIGNGKKVRIGRNEFYRMTKYDENDGGIIYPKANSFKGKVYVIVDSSNSSATFEFENLVQSHHLAKLVGEPTGGNLRGINGGAFFFLNLPNSHLEIDLPLIGQFPTAAMPDRGLQPDIKCFPSSNDISVGRDTVLEKVKRLL